MKNSLFFAVSAIGTLVLLAANHLIRTGGLPW